MKRLGLPLALLGLAAALYLVWQGDLAAVWTLLRTAGWGLALVALLHIPSMLVNARAWQLLLPGAARPTLARMTLTVWVRESVNALLPVARIGGEVAAWRILSRAGVRTSANAAALLVDLAIGIVTQAAFALLGLALLALRGTTVGWAPLLGVLGFVVVVGALFITAQRTGLFGRATALLNRLAAGQLGAVVAASARMDRAVATLYRRRAAILGCTAWQFAGWLLGVTEVWAALQVLGHPTPFLDALVLESLIQVVSSAAFLIPGALGVQEGGFLGVGALLGLSPATAVALALTRRLRDLIVFIPGLLALTWLERHSTTLPTRPVAAHGSGTSMNRSAPESLQ